jgi:peptide subunit release factor 1 (eRF1)
MAEQLPVSYENKDNGLRCLQCTQQVMSIVEEQSFMGVKRKVTLFCPMCGQERTEEVSRQYLDNLKEAYKEDLEIFKDEITAEITVNMEAAAVVLEAALKADALWPDDFKQAA